MGINLAEIGSGWKARMKGTYWQGEMPEVTGKDLECLQPIKPKGKASFVPDRFIFRLPENIHSGRIIVFSADDVEEWIAPEAQKLNNEQ